MLNLTADTHPFRVHLVQFQALSRDRYDTGGFDAATGSTSAPAAFPERGVLDANETGRKDTVRVNPGELVAIAAPFDGFAGRYVYHCHLLEHEVLRPFVVRHDEAPAAMSASAGGHEPSRAATAVAARAGEHAHHNVAGERREGGGGTGNPP